MLFSTPISQLNRVGKTTSKYLNYLGVKTARDLLFYFPFRYEDYRRVVPIGQVREGEAVTIKGKIELISNKRSFRKRKILTEALVSDDSGSIRIVWFNQPYIIRILKAGDEVFLSGKVRGEMLGSVFVSPAYEKAVCEGAIHTARLVPIYPLTEGITQKQMRFLVNQVLPLADSLKEWLPKELLEKEDLIPLPHSVRGIHFPEDEVDLEKSAKRLKFGELLLTQLRAELARVENQTRNAPELKFHEKDTKEFIARLPYILTKAQKVAAWEILRDMEKSTPMNRLLSGDVGSGKTVVAAMAALNAVLNGYQVAVMAPTEILAMQHYHFLRNLLGEKMKVSFLTHSQFQISNFKFQINIKSQISKKRIVLDEIKNDKINVVVGTHALLSEGVEFGNLGLVIVDEQHRFGVEQRRLMKKKGNRSHFLSMTATPIPRSLALTLYGDLDLSVINEMPPGRKKILTRAVEPAKREKAYAFIKEQIKQGRQCFVICPLIIENQKLKTEDSRLSDDNSIFNLQSSILSPNTDRKSVMAEHEKLSKDVFQEFKVGYLHGKMKPKEKEEAMVKFAAGETNLLVSTSVVEVGVNVPNATVMMIEGAGRFGLAQLHQFRGRVGRSDWQSYCFLFLDIESQKIKERLEFFEKNHDGFALAEKDLEMRGPGQVYGTLQSGMMQFRLAKLTDRELIKKSREAAKEIVHDIDKYPSVLKKVREWEEEVHLE